MEKVNYFILFLLSANFFIFNSLSKNDSSNPSVKTKTELLTQNSWSLTSATAAGGFSVRNYLLDCQKDNVYTFHTDGTGSADENALKCNTGDPQTNAFTWNFQSNETILFISTPLYTFKSSQYISISETQAVVNQVVSLLGTPT